jgi:hypothetical protein
MPARFTVTAELLQAYKQCRRKAFLLLRGDVGEAPHEYVRALAANAASALETFLESLGGRGLILERNPNPKLNGKVDVLAHVLFEDRTSGGGGRRSGPFELTWLENI